MTVALINTGCANIFSVQVALDRLEVPHILANSPAEATIADRLILPGVGAASPAMSFLRGSGWANALQTEARPLLGICLGMQLLFDYSAEGDVEGLGLIPGQVVPLPPFAGGVLPHMGWNTLEPRRSRDPLLSNVKANDRVYFVHGFAVASNSHAIATTTYSMCFSSMVRRENIVGCQFHPERSAAVGRTILENFMEVKACSFIQR